MRTLSPLSSKAGFTLVEILIVTAIFGVFASAMFGLYRAQNDAYAIQSQVVDMQQSLRGGMGLIIRELRMAGFDPSGKAGATIETAKADYIYFTKDTKDPDDFDGDLDENEADGKLDGSNEHVAFCLFDGQVGHHSGSSNNPSSFTHQGMVPNAKDLKFRYFDQKGDEINPGTGEIPTPEDIRSIEVTIEVENSFKGQARNRILSAKVYCRNMGL